MRLAHRKIETTILYLRISITKTMNIKTVSEIFKRLTSSQAKTPLGRWNISNNNKENTLKIRYANEDNCGVCYHNYTKRNKELDNDKKYIYMMGYESSHK